MIRIEIADVTIFYNYCGSETSVRSFRLLARRRVVVTSCNRRLQAQGSPARRPLLCHEEFRCSGSFRPVGGGCRSPAGRIEGHGFAATPGQDAGTIGKRGDRRHIRSRGRGSWNRNNFRSQMCQLPHPTSGSSDWLARSRRRGSICPTPKSPKAAVTTWVGALRW